MKDFRGKTAVITGGGAGIGFALAQVFAKAGMRVVIADLRQDHLDEAMAELAKQGAKAHAIRLDVSDRKAFAAAADEAERVFGKVHLLCNNAGVNIIRPI
ncbi:MAG TPA: SDR family NAD(P)-dependent oxidoreductase, partial [Gammaproteobacteria bacterium]